MVVFLSVRMLAQKGVLKMSGLILAFALSVNGGKCAGGQCFVNSNKAVQTTSENCGSGSCTKHKRKLFNFRLFKRTRCRGC